MHSSLVITIIIFLLLLTETLNESEAKLPKSADNSQGWHLEDSWPVRFATNCAGYLWVEVPLALVVTLAKQGYLSVVRSQLVSSNLRLLYCFLGLQASYLSWGLMQEKIMTEAYLIEIDFFFNHQHHHYNSTTSDLISVSLSASHPLMYSVRFLNAQFLIFFCRLLAFSIACGSLVASQRRHLSAYLLHSRQPALHCYSYCSLSNILSSWAQYETLKYVSFSVQVLSKGGKMMAVMLMSVVVGGKRYKRLEWAFALSISLGIWLFLLNEEEEEVKHRFDVDHHNNSPSQKLPSGLLLLTL
ncbi:hypothetical protein TYRP_018260 [Tyrophagus putrescentiae]|nr:hypothetical protein TYRP_018260 [Tyrophagus putrescentiae]